MIVETTFVAGFLALFRGAFAMNCEHWAVLSYCNDPIENSEYWTSDEARHDRNTCDRDVTVVASFVWDLGRSVSNLLWMEEILHQLVDGLSRYNPII